MHTRTLSVWLACAALLSACGGGGGEDPAPGSAVPASAMSSPEAFTAYVGSLATSETAEPLDLAGLKPPVSDTAEPRSM